MKNEHDYQKSFREKMNPGEWKAESNGLFKRLIQHQETVFRICLGFSKNPADAEDLAQEVYLKAYNRLASLKDSHLSEAWLYRIARNTCLDHHRKNRFKKLINPLTGQERNDQPTPESNASQNEQLHHLKQAIRQLPRKQREVFILKEYGHFSYQEIAANLGIQEGTVMSRLNRARLAVRRFIEEKNHGGK